MFIYGNSQQYNYYQTSKVMDKYFKSGSKSFTIHDKINYRSMYVGSCLIVE